MSIFRGIQFPGVICTALIAASALAGDKTVEKEMKKAAVLPSVVMVQRPVDAVLVRFGDMVASYMAAWGEEPITIEIDYIGNESGTDKLPNDLGQYARNVLEKIGQFLTFRTLPEGYASPRLAAAGIPYFAPDRPKHPQATFRLVGSLERATEVIVKQRNGRADALFGGGHTQSDGSLSGDRSRTITALTIALTLERANGASVPGATAQYRIYVEQTEKNNSVSIFVGGSGLGLGSRLKITQDSADALYDTIAMGVVHVLGNALRVPYYRCSEDFVPDRLLEARVRDFFTRITQGQLEPIVKRLMIVDGFGFEWRRLALTDLERAEVLVEMRHRNLDARDPMATVDLLMQLWKGLDYRAGAKRTAVLLAKDDHDRGEDLERRRREQAELAVSPEEFGWFASSRIVVVDLSRVRDAATISRIEAAVRRCVGCSEIRRLPRKRLLGVLISSKPSEVQHALETSYLRLDYVWLQASSPRLLVVPSATATANVGGSADMRR